MCVTVWWSVCCCSVGSCERSREIERSRVRDGGGESLRFWFSTFLASWWKFPEKLCLYTQLTILSSHFFLLLREKERERAMNGMKKKEKWAACFFPSICLCSSKDHDQREQTERQTNTVLPKTRALMGWSGSVICWSSTTDTSFSLNHSMTV